ncbi:type I polyketide synthase [Actinosynnema sp. ALI-1.44]|uniref:type I polyketide synthase n=1 Tax=Actinosynnema sp. ALI-1.44 TaxID=1933779 RepID=UPI00143D40B0|nr:type I polyketide synthase [Actinosynnema sp. ALI-1.44]
MTTENAVAVVGMAGRFPGARDLTEFWANIAAGKESVRDVSVGELAAEGIPEDVFTHPSYVRRAAPVDGVREFDAEFFGFTPQAARETDPQQRLFIQTVWHALEDAAMDPRRCPPQTGVFATAATSSYFLYQLISQRDPATLVGHGVNAELTTLAAGTDKDYIATRVSHLLDLRGPSMAVQTACSSSLVAVHLAVQALLNQECELAVAGGTSIRVPHLAGYRHSPGWIVSADGRCRSFDADGDGTVFGSGVGAIVLKQLDRALEDGDPVRAVILGSAVNNDGALKMGFSAPSVDAQAEVIAEALAISGVDATDIGYVEAHGTGTKLGDPVEIAALATAFAGAKECVVGSVKPNIGHLEVVSGIAGLIKTVLALEHRLIPPVPHFRAANPDLELERTPFRIATELAEWTGPLRAGVSSLGVGGTNAHVVLQAAPERAVTTSTRPRILLLSAHTHDGVHDLRQRLAGRVASLPLADVAHTLDVGRGRHPQRYVAVARNAEHAAEVLRVDAHPLAAWVEPTENASVALLFPGQGAQYAGMARGLNQEPVFRKWYTHCATAFAGHGINVDDDPVRTDIAQAALFSVEYATAKLLESVGVIPAAVAGHSLGEFVAACVAGVMDLDTAIRVVAARGRIMADAPAGAMLSVRLPESVLDLPDGLSLAAVNDPGTCVISGPADRVVAFGAELAGKGVDTRPVATGNAFHSALMDDAAAEFASVMAGVPLAAPTIPLLSNITGTWMPATDAVDPDRWARQMRATVRFADQVAELLGEPGRVLVEAGPGRALTGSARRHDLWGPGHRAVPVLRQEREGVDDHDACLLALGKLWAIGVDVDLPREGRRISLPGYPFARTEHWVDVVPLDTIGPQVPTLAPRESEASDNATLLARLWSHVLGIEDIGPDANFFDLGGDSVVAVRLIDLAAARGVPLRSQDLFDHQTLGALTRHLEAVTEPEQDHDVPFTPLQARALESGDPLAWRVPLALRLLPEMTPEIVREALEALVNHHEVLRMDLSLRDGLWEQRVGSGTAEMTIVDTDRLTETGKTVVADLLGPGPMLRAAYLRTPNQDPVLVLTVHHFASDAASERVLLGDLRHACESLVAGLPVELEPVPVPWTTWAKRQEPVRNKHFWLRERVGSIDVGEGPVGHIVREVDAEGVLALQRSSRSGVVEILLAALGKAVRKEFGSERMLVDLEGSARELADLHRTVGTCTTLYPVSVPTTGLAAARSAVREVPRQGVDYGVLRYLNQPAARLLSSWPNADILLAYLGRRADQSFEYVTEICDPARDTGLGMGYAVELRCSLADGVLVTDWCHRANPEVITRLADALVTALADLVAGPGFELADLGGDDFADLLDELGEEIG